VRGAAFEIEKRAKEKIANEPLVDTGSMLNSVHVRTLQNDGRPAAVGAARSSRPGMGQSKRRKKPVMVNDPAAIGQPSPAPKKELEAVVGVAVEYAVFHEKGAPRRGIPARPFLGPAFEEVKRDVPRVLASELRKEGL
jgi:phage gpG-like protein